MFKTIFFKIRLFLLAILFVLLTGSVGSNISYAIENPAFIVKPSVKPGTGSFRIYLKRVAGDPVGSIDWDDVKDKMESLKNPIDRNLLTWFYYKRCPKIDANFSDINNFIKETENWPGQGFLILEAEKRLSDVRNQDTLKDWFSKHKPRTVEGAFVYASFLKNENELSKRAQFLKDFWRNVNMNKSDRGEFVKHFGDVLSQEEHMERIDTLIWEEDYKEAETLYRKVPKSWRALARARIKLALNENGVDYAIQQVPANLQNHEGLVYERMRWRRKRNKDADVVDLLINHMPDDLSHPKIWWRERHILIRRMLEEKDFDTAFKLAKTHRQTDGFPRAQADWITGWLALRFMNQPELAYEKFVKMADYVKSPISQSRANYWAGRASLELGRTDEAIQWLSAAARFSTMYYGQLAYTKLLEITDGDVKVYAFPELRDDQISGFSSKEATYLNKHSDYIDVVYALKRADLKLTLNAFMKAWIDRIDRPEEILFVRNFAYKIDHKNSLVRLSKKALSQGYLLLNEGYPFFHGEDIDFSTLEPALAYGIIRQESAFNAEAQSPVGALGLMQLMPSTARHTAKKYNIPYRSEWLTQRPSYNVRLGSIYLEELLNRFDGYYVLAIASYNAGPYRMSKIVDTIGDPRNPNVDLIDWIEMVPIYETRNYIQRVLEAMHVYRNRFSSVFMATNDVSEVPMTSVSEAN